MACAAARLPRVEEMLEIQPEVRGFLTLSTCNRVDVYLEVGAGAEKQIRELLCGTFFPPSAAQGTSPGAPQPLFASGTEAITHIFRVACGLDSMVVGEREITGQLRRAHLRAINAHTSSAALNRITEAALHTSRQVARNTGLASAGRSVVAQALHLCRDVWENDPARVSVLLLGTGAYAGAGVAALRARQIERIAVYSKSGRAQLFARSHNVQAVSDADLPQMLQSCDLVISCRGLNAPVLTYGQLADIGGRRTSVLPILDLALQRDVEKTARSLPFIKLIDLETVKESVPEVAVKHLEAAKEIISRGVADLERKLTACRADSAVVALRSFIGGMCAEEIERIPCKDTYTKADLEYALRHFANRVAHIPSVGVRKAAVAGEQGEYLQALHAVFGVELSSAAAENGCVPDRRIRES